MLNLSVGKHQVCHLQKIYIFKSLSVVFGGDITFVEKVKGFITSPSSTFDASKQDSLGDAIKYYAVIIAIYSALLAVMFMLAFSVIGSMSGPLGMFIGAGLGAWAGVLLFVMMLILLIIGAFIDGAILHIFVYIVGGRKGIDQTIKAVMYSFTPSLLFGWVPIIGVLAVIWDVILLVIGIRQLHDLTTGKAILAVFLPLIIVGVLIIALFSATSVFRLFVS